MSSLEQSANIKFSVLLKKSPKMLKILRKEHGSDSSSRGFLAVSMTVKLKGYYFVNSDEVIQSVTKQLLDL
ncbi:hypothetical protein TNCV_4205801 [Trichonephila clavipes]|nr:hypothetical protein TNCV_4205801 [Trichonephila clavipes]